MYYFYKKRQLIVFIFSLLSAYSVLSLEHEDDFFDLSFEELMNLNISSASKRSEETKDIAGSVTIVPRREIQKYGYTTLDELFRNIPGFYLNNITEDQHIGTRGTIGGGIQFLVNGVPQHPSIAKGLSIPELSRFNIPIESIDRIEVVRGPMSVIYGNNAFKGSINIITNDVSTQGSMVAGAYGTQDTSKLFGRYAALTDNGYATINIGTYKTEGLSGKYKDMMTPAQVAALDPAMHTSLQGDVAHDNFNVDLSTAWKGLSANLRYSNMDYGFYALSPSFGPGNQLDLETFNGMLGYNTELTKTLTLNSSFIYSHEEYDFPQFDVINASVQNLPFSQFQENSRSELELNLIYQPSKTLSLLTGYRYRRTHDTLNDVSLAAFGLDVETNTDDAIENDIFFQVSYQLNESLKLIAGNRWTQTKSYNSVRTDRLTNISVTTPLHPDEEISSTPNIAIIYSINENQHIKFLYGEALQDHRSASFSDHEEITTSEINYIAIFEKMYFSLNLFRSNSDHLLRESQRFNSNTGLYESIVDNSGALETTGTEFIIKYQLTSKLDFEFSSSLQETDDKNNSSIDVGESPKLLAKVKASYQASNINYSLFAHYVSSMKSDFVFLQSATPGEFSRLGEEVGSSLSVGANIRYDHSSSGLYTNLHVENLLDEDIYVPANQLVNTEKGLLSQERQIILTVGITF